MDDVGASSSHRRNVPGVRRCAAVETVPSVDEAVETVDNSRAEAFSRGAGGARESDGFQFCGVAAGCRCSLHTPRRRASIDDVSFSDVPTVTVSDVPPIGPDVVLLDVRESDEWDLGHAPGALHIPMSDVPARLDEIDIDAEVYVVCRQGGRSLAVVEYLSHVGYEAIQVHGGMVSWQQNGLPLTADGDTPAKIY